MGYRVGDDQEQETAFYNFVDYRIKQAIKAEREHILAELTCVMDDFDNKTCDAYIHLRGIYQFINEREDEELDRT